MEAAKKTILIVDDERFYINLLIDLLAQDYDTMVAKNGSEAFDRALNAPDLILLDVVMPDIDGYKVCEQLKSDLRTTDIPIIFLTVKSDIDDEVRGFELGAVDYITKPISPPILKARVATHLALSEARQILAQQNIELLSEQRQKDEQLRCSQKLQALGRLTGGIAHDFNNILGIVVGYAELLLANLKSDRQLENYARQVLHAGERGEKITHKLLSFSRQKSFEPSVFNINEVLHEEQAMLERTLTPRIRLSMQLYDPLWPIYVDKDDLENAILNISINAMHALGNDGTYHLKTWNQTLPATGHPLTVPQGDYVCLSLTDNGCGMDVDTRNRMFDPFFSTKGEKGTGLGMSQVYGFMERCGGHIDVKSELDQGTEITLYFPRFVEHGTDDETGKEAELSAQVHGNETILVVDDEHALRDLLNEVLSEYGYKVLTASDAAEALQILSRESVDLVLTDVIMPGMNGYELSDEIQKQYPNVKIQVVSGYGDDHYEGAAHQELHQQRLIKPVHASVILKRIRDLL